MFEVKPFKIGPLTVEMPVVLAALAGYSDLPYRRICRECGVSYCTTEAMLDKTMIDDRLRRRLVKIGADDHPVAAQIMGSGPETMAKAAGLLAGMGFDVIDLNFACPVRKVLGRHRGGYLMGQSETVIEIIRAVMHAVRDRPITIKLRRAFHEDDTDYESFWRISQAAFDAGVAAICVHARSVDQKYMGQADWGFLRKVKERYPTQTIVGSGDVFSAADALAMLAQTGVDGVSAARGAIGNPWLFRQVRQLLADGFDPRTLPPKGPPANSLQMPSPRRAVEFEAQDDQADVAAAMTQGVDASAPQPAAQEADDACDREPAAAWGVGCPCPQPPMLYKPTVAEQRDILLRHFAMTCEVYGAGHGPKIMRKFGIKYARAHPTPGKVRAAFVAVQNLQDWQAVLDTYYG